MNTRLLILHLRAARRRARTVAAMEARCLLRDLQPEALPGGPLSERGGLIWIAIDATAVEEAVERLPRLGYCDAVDLLDPEGADGEVVRWRGCSYRLTRVYEEDTAALRERAPDRRTFVLETPVGGVRPVVGYRGDGGPLSRRGLPVVDARLLVNLVFSPERGVLLDPFAGVGSIAVEALASGWRVMTADVDPALRHGLAALGAQHVVADAQWLPLADQSIDAIATEPPYDQGTEQVVRGALREMHRVLKADGRLAILCAAWQREPLHEEAAGLGLIPYLDSPIDRKGLPVAVLAWEKAPAQMIWASCG